VSGTQSTFDLATQASRTRAHREGPPDVPTKMPSLAGARDASLRRRSQGIRSIRRRNRVSVSFEVGTSHISAAGSGWLATACRQLRD
jgi:hypothetical protein